MALKRRGCAKAENQTVDFIFIGVVSLRQVLKIRCGGKIFVEHQAPVNLGHPDVIKVTVRRTAQIGIADADVVFLPAIPLAGDV